MFYPQKHKHNTLLQTTTLSHTNQKDNVKEYMSKINHQCMHFHFHKLRNSE